jgi:hypothetical protein
MRRPHWTALIVLCIVAVLVGLSLPFFLMLRESATRAKCSNNLREWAFALQGAADTYQWDRGGQSVAAFPAGTVSNPALPLEQRWSWYLAMLPFMEQANVYQLADQTRGPSDPKNRAVVEHRFRQLVCPVSGDYDFKDHEWKTPNNHTHYVGVAGVGADAATLPTGHPRAGVFGYDRRTAIKDGIPDGTSNTLLLIETAQNPGHWAHGGPATVRGIEPGAEPYIGAGRPFGGFHATSRWDWSRSREHVSIAAMADGTVRVFSHTTATEVLEALATVGGKETLPVDW